MPWQVLGTSNGKYFSEGAGLLLCCIADHGETRVGSGAI